MSAVNAGAVRTVERARARDVDRDLLLDPARPRGHHVDHVAEEHRLVDVVGDEQHGLVALLPDAEQHLLHQRARLAVERAERLVHQQDLGVVGERAGERHALAHAARELLGIGVLEALEPDLPMKPVRDPPPLGGGHAAQLEPELDVAPDGQPGEQRVALEHHAALGRRAGDRRGRPA